MALIRPSLWVRSHLHARAADVQYNDADQLNSYLMVGGTIIDSMTKGTNSTVIVCGARGAGKSYVPLPRLGRSRSIVGQPQCMVL